MKPQHFLTQIEHDQIVAAIGAAEARTTGKIRVYISHRRALRPVHAATRHFQIQRLHQHAPRNAVLIFVAPKSHTFAVVGDQAIHEKCGETFWQDLTRAMTTHFKSGNYTAGILHAIAQTGQALERYFPREA